MEKNNFKIYSWEGKDTNGEKMTGEMEALNLTMVKAILRSKKIIALKIKIKPTLFLNRFKKIRAKDITIFTRQLATMLTSGIPLIQCFSLISKGCPNLLMKNLINKIKIKVEAGHAFSETLEAYPQYFNKLYCSLINTGEQIGALDKILDHLATYKEKIESLKIRLKKAFIYPITILSIAIIITMIILIFVIPQFESLFNNFGTELPFFTRKVVLLSNIVGTYCWVLLISIITIFVAVTYGYKKYPQFQNFIEKNSLKLPLFGKLVMKATIARFARTLATTFKAGIPIVNALNSVSTATGNIVFESATKQIQNEIFHGQSLHAAMKKSKCFPEMVIQMIAIGEETGKLDYMLTKIADYYEEEVDHTVETISTLLEPIMMLVIGLIIGGLVIAMYLPIFKMGTVI